MYFGVMKVIRKQARESHSCAKANLKESLVNCILNSGWKSGKNVSFLIFKNGGKFILKITQSICVRFNFYRTTWIFAPKLVIQGKPLQKIQFSNISMNFHPKINDKIQFVLQKLILTQIICVILGRKIQIFFNLNFGAIFFENWKWDFFTHFSTIAIQNAI